MNRLFSVAAVLALALAVGFGPTVAAGQESAGNATTTATATTTEEPTPTPSTSEEIATEARDELEESETPTDQEENETVDGQPLDDEITLTDWRYSDGAFVLTLYHSGERPKRVTVSEATQPGEGVSRYSVERERLLPGETTLTLPARTNGGEAAAGITSSDAIQDQGGGLRISTGDQGANPFRNFGGTTGVLSGSGITMVLALLAAVFVVWREESGVIEA